MSQINELYCTKCSGYFFSGRVVRIDPTQPWCLCYDCYIKYLQKFKPLAETTRHLSELRFLFGLEE